MDKNFVPRLFASYCKLLCDYFEYLLKRNHFLQHQMSKTKFEVHKKHLKVLVKWNWWWNFTCMCLHNFSELWNWSSRVPMGNWFFWCYFRQLFISLALRKCKKDCKIFKIILVPDFHPLRTEIARFYIQFCLNTFKRLSV